MGNRKLLLFEMISGKFALDTDSILKVVPASELSRYPDMPKSLLGLANFAGNIIPAIDLEYLTERKKAVVSPDNYFIIFKSGDISAIVMADTLPEIVDDYIKNDSLFDRITIKPELVENAVIVDNEIVIELSTGALVSQEMLEFIDKTVENAY
jgi:chemotaxis signal transduction protein